MTLPGHEITKQIIACAFKVHNSLGAGFLEKVYQNALAVELRIVGLKVECQVPITVHFVNYLAATG